MVLTADIVIFTNTAGLFPTVTERGIHMRRSVKTSVHNPLNSNELKRFKKKSLLVLRQVVFKFKQAFMSFVLMFVFGCVCVYVCAHGNALWQV